MLHACLLGALDDAAIVDLWLEDLADHAEFRPDGGGDGVDRFDQLRVQHLLAEPGPVVDEQMLQLGPLLFRQQRGGVEHFVGALAVPAHVVGPAGANALIQILQTALLGFGLGEADHKILFPPGDGAVRAAKSDVSRESIQMECDCRELDGYLGIEFVHVVADIEIPEALGFRRIPNEVRHGLVLFGGHHLHGFPVKAFEAFAQGMLLVPLPIHIGKLPVGQPAEDQIVHLVEGDYIKGKVCIPTNVIYDAIHSISLF